MPDGKTHAFATIAASLATPWIVHGLGVGATTTDSIVAAAGCFLGILITPDLDVNHGCASIREIHRRFGKTAAAIWRSIWYPYALMVPHRSWVSHLPVAGTAFRLGYLYLVYFLIALIVGATGLIHMPEVRLTAQGILHSYLIWAFAGLALADALHFAMDKALHE
jgi:uncharacterized metal-binding protein